MKDVEPSAVAVQAGYLELVRGNKNFRWLWVGNIISLLGDWFNTIALYNLVAQMTGSPLALAWVFITKMLPFAIVSPLAGLVTDRFNRRVLMIGADLIRSVIVLGFLLVESSDDLALLYVLTALQVSLGAVFIPARSAVIPNITSSRELLTANALMAATWSSLLAIGAALGGFAAQFLGEKGVFVVDSLTYLVSAFCISRTVIPQAKMAALRKGFVDKARQTLEDVVGGWKYILHTPEIRRIVLAKASWSVGGGGLVFIITLLAGMVHPAAPAAGIGILFSARGIGTGIGPIAARAIFRDEKMWPKVLGGCVLVSGIFYLSLSQISWTLWLMVPFVLAAHTPSGANWVLSTVLLQKRSHDSYRGRLFSSEWLLLTLVDSSSILAAAYVLEYKLLGIGTAMAVFASTQVLMGILWLITVVPAERRATRVVQTSANW